MWNLDEIKYQDNQELKDLYLFFDSIEAELWGPRLWVATENPEETKKRNEEKILWDLSLRDKVQNMGNVIIAQFSNFKKKKYSERMQLISKDFNTSISVANSLEDAKEIVSKLREDIKSYHEELKTQSNDKWYTNQANAEVTEGIQSSIDNTLGKIQIWEGYTINNVYDTSLDLTDVEQDPDFLAAKQAYESAVKEYNHAVSAYVNQWETLSDLKIELADKESELKNVELSGDGDKLWDVDKAKADAEQAENKKLMLGEEIALLRKKIAYLEEKSIDGEQIAEQEKEQFESILWKPIPVLKNELEGTAWEEREKSKELKVQEAYEKVDQVRERLRIQQVNLLARKQSELIGRIKNDYETNFKEKLEWENSLWSQIKEITGKIGREWKEYQDLLSKKYKGDIAFTAEEQTKYRTYTKEYFEEQFVKRDALIKEWRDYYAQAMLTYKQVYANQIHFIGEQKKQVTKNREDLEDLVTNKLDPKIKTLENEIKKIYDMLAQGIDKNTAQNQRDRKIKQEQLDLALKSKTFYVEKIGELQEREAAYTAKENLAESGSWYIDAQLLAELAEVNEDIISLQKEYLFKQRDIYKKQIGINEGTIGQIESDREVASYKRDYTYIIQYKVNDVLFVSGLVFQLSVESPLYATAEKEQINQDKKNVFSLLNQKNLSLFKDYLNNHKLDREAVEKLDITSKEYKNLKDKRIELAIDSLDESHGLLWSSEFKASLRNDMDNILSENNQDIGDTEIVSNMYATLEEEITWMDKRIGTLKQHNKGLDKNLTGIKKELVWEDGLSWLSKEERDYGLVSTEKDNRLHTRWELRISALATYDQYIDLGLDTVHINKEETDVQANSPSQEEVFSTAEGTGEYIKVENPKELIKTLTKDSNPIGSILEVEEKK